MTVRRRLLSKTGMLRSTPKAARSIVAEAKTGKIVWQEWLGDPLMSQPAISRGRLFMAHPAGQRGHAVPNASQPRRTAEPVTP